MVVDTGKSIKIPLKRMIWRYPYFRNWIFENVGSQWHMTMIWVIMIIVMVIMNFGMILDFFPFHPMIPRCRWFHSQVNWYNFLLSKGMLYFEWSRPWHFRQVSRIHSILQIFWPSTWQYLKSIIYPSLLVSGILCDI